MDEPSVVYRAKFEWHILPVKPWGTKIASEPRGPFEVEVYNAGTKNKPLWQATLMPTRQNFGGRAFKSAGECRNTVAGNFRKQIHPWREQRPFVPEQTSLLD